MWETLMASQGLATFNALFGILLVWGCLRFLDRLGGQDFHDLWQDLRAGGHTGLGLYLGARIVAVALLVGAVLR